MLFITIFAIFRKKETVLISTFPLPEVGGSASVAHSNEQGNFGSTFPLLKVGQIGTP